MKSIGIWLGLLSGILGIGIYLFLYYTDVTLLFRWLGLIGFLLGFIFMIITAVIQHRNPFYYHNVSANSLTFRTAVKPIFTVFVLLMGCLCIFHYLMFNLIDTSLLEQYRTWNLERIPAYMKSVDSSMEDIEQAKAHWQGTIELGWKDVAHSFLFYQIPGFFMAVIITALSQLLPNQQGSNGTL